LIQAIGVGVAASLGFGGTFIIMKVIDVLIGVRVSTETEGKGLDIEEHAERAYVDEDEFGKI
jgi:ammonium transporter, Amt family